MGVLLMLVTIGGLIGAGVMLAIAVITRKVWLRNFVLGGVSLWVVSYVVILLGFSLASEDKELAFNEPKAFCGFYFDCHMHATVSGVRRVKTIGERTADGEFYIVRVRIFSDARRVSLALITVDAHVVDNQDREYPRDTRAESELPEHPPLEKQVGPNESFEKEIVFDLPTGIKRPRMDLREGLGIDHVIEMVLVDDEDSILHGRKFFILDGTTALAGNQEKWNDLTR